MAAFLIILIIAIVLIIAIRSSTKTEKEQTSSTYKVNIESPHPENSNDYKLYKFISEHSKLIIEPWYIELKRQGYKLRPNIEKAIITKIETDEFKNPISFKEFYGDTFDYIAIDFETASRERISACALGICFVKDEAIADEVSFYIKPPEHIKFENINIGIHHIRQTDVEYSLNFKEHWDSLLSEYFNRNILALHNASMDASVLKQTLEFYGITDYNIRYVDTMQIAKRLGFPAKLTELAKALKLEVKEEHNPKYDALLCAQVLSEFLDKGIKIEDHLVLIKPQKGKIENISIMDDDNLYDDSDEIIKKFQIQVSEIDKILIPNSSFLFTGELSISRDTAKSIIKNKGGIIRPGISKNVDYVIIGSGYGPSKLSKISEYNELKNCNIKILLEEHFLKLIKD